MNRVQKKCLIASLALHALLCLILLVGPAFLSANRPNTDLPTLEVIPAKIVDSLFSGGGNPNAKPAAPQRIVEPPPPVQPTETRPPEPTPRPPQVREQVKEQAPREAVEKPAPQKPGIKVSSTLVKRGTEPDVKEKARAEADAKAKAQAEVKARADARRRTAQQLESRLNSAFDSLNKNLSSGTTVEPLGPGGEAYADYGQVVKSYYDQAWIIPDDVSEDAATVPVKVVIRRDGTVALDSIQKRSGISALDRSVQNAVDRVRLRGLPPFPEGAKESQRTYIINFNLKAKRLVG